MNWTKRWRIKLHENKSQHINFTLKKESPLPITINQQMIPYSNSAKYPGMTFDAKFRWKEHTKIKRKQLNHLRLKMEWIIDRYSKLSVHNKLLLYKQILKPICVEVHEILVSYTIFDSSFIAGEYKLLRSAAMEDSASYRE